MIDPIGNRVVLKLTEQETVSSGGIILKEDNQKKSTEGMVIAVGPGTYSDTGTFIPTTIKVDEKVLITKYAGTDIQLDGEDYTIVSELDILAVLEV